MSASTSRCRCSTAGTGPACIRRRSQRARYRASTRSAGLNDQHAHIEVPKDSPLQVGDRLCFGVSHPCTTFDRWQLIYEVDAAMNVVGGIRTYF